MAITIAAAARKSNFKTSSPPHVLVVAARRCALSRPTHPAPASSLSLTARAPSPWPIRSRPTGSASRRPGRIGRARCSASRSRRTIRGITTPRSGGSRPSREWRKHRAAAERRMGPGDCRVAALDHAAARQRRCIPSASERCRRPRQFRCTAIRHLSRRGSPNSRAARSLE
jgi:hypothetical protein